MPKIIIATMIMAMASFSHGMINQQPCLNDNLQSATCSQYIRGYTYAKLVNSEQEIHNSNNGAFFERAYRNRIGHDPQAQRDNIVLACHKAVSVNNLVKKIQGKLTGKEQIIEELNQNIDEVLDAYLGCRHSPVR